jgi:hypothetical protein
MKMKKNTKAQFLKLTIYLFTIIIFPLNSNAQWQILKDSITESFSDGIASMVNDVNGNLYVASGKIVYKWDGKYWSKLGGSNYSFNGDVKKIVKDNSGNIFASGEFTNSKGKFYIAKFDGTAWTEFGILEGEKFFDGGIYKMVFDKNDNLYASPSLMKGNGPYISKFTKDGKMEILGDTNNPPFDYPPNYIEVDFNGNLYALGRTNSVVYFAVKKFDGKSWLQLPDPDTSLYRNISTGGLASDVFGNIYVGGTTYDQASSSYKSKLLKWNNKSWINHNDREFIRIGSYPLNKIIIDESRNIYVAGKAGKGSSPIISVLKDSVWEDLSWLNNSDITNIAYDNVGTLYAAGGYDNSIVAKYLIKPTITSFTPTYVSSGGTVTIKGKNFNGTNSVTFGGVVASSFTVINDTTINAIVGNGSTGSVSVTTPGGKDSLAGFIFNPYKLGIAELQNNQIQLYPNPAQETITIKSELNLNGKEYCIFDFVGKLVLRGKFSDDIKSVSVSELNNGVYILTISDSNNKLISTNKMSIIK